MANYLQLGHESWNLVDDPQLGTFAGVVLSPVNDSPEEIIGRLKGVREKQPHLDVILDPQLYNPVAQKGQLPRWGYYGSDFETADRTDPTWWRGRIPEVVKEARRVGATTMCSPAPIQYRGSDEYFQFVVDLADESKAIAAQDGMDCALTAIVPLDTLQDQRRAYELASILSSSRCDRIYLNLLVPDRLASREPSTDQAALATAVHLVRLLSRDQRIHVACASHDVVLWLGSGATDVSTGKYMNVRRFTPSRWMDEQSQGRNIAYWSDDKLLTLIRDQEVLRLDREGWFQNRAFEENPAAAAVLAILRNAQGEAWLRLSWIQYMRWFSNTAEAVSDADSAAAMLEAAYEAWREVQRAKILFVDPFNDGTHAIAWMNAFNEGMGR